MRFTRRKIGKLAVLGVLSIVILSSSGAIPAMTLTSDPCVTSRNFTLATYASNFPNTTSIGPLGIAYRLDGQVLVTDWADGKLRRLPNHGDGQTGPYPVAIDYGAARAIPLGQIQFGSVYKFFAGRDTPNNDVIEIDQDGNIVGTPVATGMGSPRGMAAYPSLPNAPLTVGLTGHLFVGDSLNDIIYNVDPVAKTKTTFVSVGAGIDAIAFDVDGSHLYVAVSSTNAIRGFNVSNATVSFNSAVNSSGIDGVAIGLGTLTGYVYANYNSGDVWEYGLPGGPNPGSQCHIATGGSRGDFIASDPYVYCGGGAFPSLLLTQTSEIARLCAPNGGFFAGPTSSITPLPAGSNIPTLSEWGMVLLVLLLGTTGVFLVRRRSSQAPLA